MKIIISVFYNIAENSFLRKSKLRLLNLDVLSGSRNLDFDEA